MDEAVVLILAVVFLLLLSSSGAGAWFLTQNKAPALVPSWNAPPTVGLGLAPVIVNPPVIPTTPSNRDPTKKCRGRGKDVGKPGGVYTWDFDSRDGADLYTCPGYDNWCCKMNADGSVAPGWGRGGGLFAFEKLDSKGCGVETGAQYCNSNPVPAAAATPASSGGNRDPSRKCHGRGKDVGNPGGVYTWDFDSRDGADLYTCPGNDNWCCKMNADGSVAPGWGRGGGLFAFEKLDSKGCGVETGAQFCNSAGGGGNPYGTPQCQWPNDPNLPSAAVQNQRGEPWYECPDDKTKCCNTKTSTRHPVCGSYPGSSQATCQRPGANPPPPPNGGGGGGGGTYIVQSGDSLWAIANKHGMSLDGLRGLNPGVSDLIMPGQAIKVSGVAAPPINGGGGFDCGSVGPNRQQGCTPASCPGCPPGYTWTQVNGLKCGRANAQECPSQTDIVPHGSSGGGGGVASGTLCVFRDANNYHQDGNWIECPDNRADCCDRRNMGSRIPGSNSIGAQPSQTQPTPNALDAFVNNAVSNWVSGVGDQGGGGGGGLQPAWDAIANAVQSGMNPTPNPAVPSLWNCKNDSDGVDCQALAGNPVLKGNIDSYSFFKPNTANPYLIG